MSSTPDIPGINVGGLTLADEPAESEDAVALGRDPTTGRVVRLPVGVPTPGTVQWRATESGDIEPYIVPDA